MANRRRQRGLLAPAGCRHRSGHPSLERDNFRLERENERLRAMIEDIAVTRSRGNGQPAATKTPANSATFAPQYKSGAEGRSEADGERAAGRGAQRRNAPAPQPQSARNVQPADRRKADRSLRPPARRPRRRTGRPRARSAATRSSLPAGDAAGVRQGVVLAVPIHPSGTSRRWRRSPSTAGFPAALPPRAVRRRRAAVGGRSRDRLGRPVAAPADMSVAVYDPALRDEEGMAVLVGRWDFTAAETRIALPTDRPASRGPPVDGLAQRPAQAPQAARLRPLRYGRRPEAASRRVDRHWPARAAADPSGGNARLAAHAGERNDGPQLLPVERDHAAAAGVVAGATVGHWNDRGGP